LTAQIAALAIVNGNLDVAEASWHAAGGRHDVSVERAAGSMAWPTWRPACEHRLTHGT
jgi:hypothetical protein